MLLGFTLFSRVSPFRLRVMLRSSYITTSTTAGVPVSSLLGPLLLSHNPPTPEPNPPVPAQNPPASLPPAEILHEFTVVASPPLVATSTPLQQIPCVDRHNVFDDVANEYMQQQIMQDRTAREIHSHEQTLRLQIYENLLMRRGR